MKPKNIYNFLIGLQPKNNRGTYNSDVKLLSADDLRLPFVGREDAMDEIAKYFKERITARDAKIDDRMKYPIPACAWIPGLGKTGLLHQGKEILHRSGVTGKQIYIIVPYYNGHSLQWIDRELSIECSFAWRLLFMVFLKWNGPEFADFCALKMLPINCEKLTLSIALQTVRVGIIDKNCMDEMLNIFVGIDEFQKIAKEEDEQRKNLLSSARNCTITASRATSPCSRCLRARIGVSSVKPATARRYRSRGFRWRRWTPSRPRCCLKRHWEEKTSSSTQLSHHSTCSLWARSHEPC